MAIKWIETEWAIDNLRDYEHNPRRLKKHELEKLIKSLQEDGYHQRIVIDTDGTIIGGHQRKQALLKAGFKKTDKIRVLVPERKLTDEEFDRVNIRDNLQAGEFDFDILGNRFEAETLIGWGMPEEWLDFNVEEVDIAEEDNIAPGVKDESITKLGDIWQLGEHRLMCGDSVSINDVEKLLNNELPDIVYTDPPYGVDIVKNKKISGDKAFGSVGSDRIIKVNTYAKIIGDETTQTAIDSYNLCASLQIPILIFWGGNYYASALPDSSNWVVWDKENPGTDFADCELAWTNQKGRMRLFRHKWQGMIKASEHGERRVHPTQKPIELALWCFKEYAPESKIVLDLFGGSGSTLIACEKSNRKCLMMELSPNYCDVIIARWEKLTGKKAELLQ